MSKFFRFMDNLPIVRILQIFAVVNIFFIIVAQIYYQVFFNQPDFIQGSDLYEFFKNYWTKILTFFQSFFMQASSSLVLLGLAEIIKLMQQKQKFNEVEDVK